MKNYLYTIALSAIGIVALSSCKKYLQDGSLTEGPITGAQVWGNDAYARGVLNNAYFSVMDRYSLDGNGAMQASGSDEAVNSNLNSSINIFNNGTWSPVRTVDDVYADMYAGIRKANLFLENAETSAIIPIDGLTFAQDVARMRGEAFFLRAYFHFELLQRYGAIPLVTRTLGVSEELNLPKNTLEDCVKQILLDCDSAITRLPETTQAWATASRGRAGQTSAQALKSRLLLYMASPYYNPNNDVVKWQAAADAAKLLIDRNKHALYTAYNTVFLFGTAAYNTEVMFATEALNRNDIETNNAPISYDGALGRTDPTQEMVDAFEMRTTGKPVTDATSGYNEATPYLNRDPRLNITIMYNTGTFKSKTVDIFEGGKDAIGVNVNATKTGYYMRKFMNENVTWNQASNTNSRRPWVIFRYAETLLNYAEALNEVQGPVADVYKYVNMIRARTGVAMPALPAGLTKDQMRARIHNERRVELCFEGHRFFDVRRWKEGELFFNKPVTGMRAVKVGAAFTYTRFQVENRVFTAKNYLYPFSQNDINRQPALVQNPGY